MQMSYIIQKLRSFTSSRSGSSAVEFAVVLPVFLLALLVLIEVAFAIHSQSTLQQVAEGVARGILFDQGHVPSEAEIKNAFAGTILTPSSVTSSAEIKDTPYKHVSLNLSYTYKTVGPIQFPDGINLSSSVSIPISTED